MKAVLTTLTFMMLCITLSVQAQYQMNIENNAYVGKDLHVGKKIGVGTTTLHPNAGLHLFDSGNLGDLYIENDFPFIQFLRRESGNGGMQFKLNNTTEAELYYYGAGNVLSMHTGGFGNISTGLNIDTNNEVGIGTSAPAAKLDVQGASGSAVPVLKATTNYSGTSDVYGIDSYSIPADGYGYGGRFRGGYIGAYGWATGGAANRTVYGVYGYATGGARRYAIFGFGDVKVNSRLFVGTTGAMEDAAAAYEVLVDGQILCEELVVENSNSWPDYVFKEDYKLLPLEDLEASIQQNGHLPGVPSAEEIDESGLKVGEMQYIMMEKIEELTLYVIQLKKENDELRQEMKKMRKGKNK